MAMKKTLFFIVLFSSFLFVVQSCKNKTQKNSTDFIAENIDFAAKQYGLMTEMIEDSGKILNPKSFINGKHVFIPPWEWTSGFSVSYTHLSMANYPS